MISVVMAARNYGRYISEAISSVKAQTYHHWELVIIDDGSSDETPAVVKGYLSDRRIRYVQSDRLGQSRAKNLGVRLSQHPYLAFLDADDAWHPKKLERQIAVLEEAKFGVIATERTLIGPDESHAGTDEQLRLCDRGGPVRIISRDEIFVSNPICFSSTLMTREAYDRAGGFNESLDLGVDYDLWMRVSALYVIAKLEQPLTYYRTGHANLSSRQGDRIATAFTIMERWKQSVSRQAVQSGYATTHRSLAWHYRRSNAFQALEQYALAMKYSQGRGRTLREAAATLVRMALAGLSRTVPSQASRG